MGSISLCLVLLFYLLFELRGARLNIRPNRSQFFWYDSVTLSCVATGNSNGWTLYRNTSQQTSEPCSSGWGLPRESSCTIDNVYPSDAGVYWCESESGESSNTINIDIADGSVILESPAIPVTEGNTVTLFCQYKEEENHNSTSNFSAHFFKNGVFFGTYPSGNIIFSSVSKSDEGFYSCKHPTQEESPQSWLAVASKVRTEPPPPPPPPPLMSLPRLLCTVTLIVLYTVMLAVCVNKYINWAKARDEVNQIASNHCSVE